MFHLRDVVRSCALATLMVAAAQGAWTQEKTTSLFKVITVKDEIVIGLSADDMRSHSQDRVGTLLYDYSAGISD